MDLNILKEIICEFKDDLIIKDGRHSLTLHNKNIFKNINNKYNKMFKNLTELIYLVKNFDNLNNINILCYCGNKNTFSSFKSGYNKFCSHKCCNNSIEQRKNHSLKMLSKSKEEKQLIRLKVYNTKSKNGTLPDSEIVRNKHKNTIKNMSNERKKLIQERIYESKVRNGTLQNSSYIINKFKEKMLNKTKEEKQLIENKKFNTKLRNGTLQNSTDVIKKVKTSWKNKSREEIKNIALKTNLTKIKKGNHPSNNSIKQKRYNTMKQNGTLGGPRSKAEIRCYEKAKLKFLDIKHSYFEDPRYPFNCDMYIPSQDLFIECHFSKYHHYKPFDQNCVGDLVELNKLKNIMNDSNSTDYQKKECNDIITTWTIRDPLKLETFNKNNLNYKIFYTEKEFGDWIEKCY